MSSSELSLPSLPTNWRNFVPWGMQEKEITERRIVKTTICNNGETTINETQCEFKKIIIDSWTNQIYFYQPSLVLRIKHFALATIGQVGQTIALVMHAIYRTKRIFSFGATNRQEDFLKILATPFVFIGLWIASIYGLVFPYNGQKLYASIERAQFGSITLEVRKYFNVPSRFHECTFGDGWSSLGVLGWRMAPCFQPKKIIRHEPIQKSALAPDNSLHLPNAAVCS